MSSLQDSIAYKGKRVVFKSMAVYALGDMHLSFMAHKPMDKFGKVWKNHEEKIEQNCNRIIQSGDTFVITGDHSWGRKLADAKPDLEFIANLPGEKILLRGNHDMFWNAKKTVLLNEQYEPRLHFLQNNYYCYHDYALVGTKGYTFEGPFLVNAKGQIISWNPDDEKQAQKLVQREAERLRMSFEAAKNAGFKKYIMFLHYPPTNIMEIESVFTQMAEEYGAEHVVYSHCHGKLRYADSIRGMHHGICYHLVSGDYLNFTPEKIVD